MTAEPTRRIPATAADTSAENPWPVRLLSAKLTDYLTRAPAVWVEGQVVQLTRRPGQSTCYLTLRDPDVDLSFQVLVHTQLLDRLEFPLGEGARVVAHVRAQLYPRRGSLSLSADQLRPVGVGELLARLEALRRLLAAEGLFDPQSKRPLPFLPVGIGLVCGRASAAERDVVENARRRWPGVPIRIEAVAVQGPHAVADVSAAVARLNAAADIDVIVIARGGGSVEDLLPFSNETLLRAVAACTTPVVSAIGHEVDCPLLDLVADVRASTPTDAATIIVPDVQEEHARLRTARERTERALRAHLHRERTLLADLRARPALADPHRLLHQHGEHLTQQRHRSRQALDSRLRHAGQDVLHLRERVLALSPAATLARGYAVVQDASGRVLRSTEDAPAEGTLRIRLVDGDVFADVRAD